MGGPALRQAIIASSQILASSSFTIIFLFMLYKVRVNK
jgi:hypothetical protein